jgi:nucleoside-diphosphate-sugar epimerase
MIIARSINTRSLFIHLVKRRIEWNSLRSDGMLRKCMDLSKITSLGFKPKIALKDGIAKMISDYKYIIKTI